MQKTIILTRGRSAWDGTSGGNFTPLIVLIFGGRICHELQPTARRKADALRAGISQQKQ
jgi:hypothetical protein